MDHDPRRVPRQAGVDEGAVHDGLAEQAGRGAIGEVDDAEDHSAGVPLVLRHLEADRGVVSVAQDEGAVAVDALWSEEI